LQFLLESEEEALVRPSEDDELDELLLSA